MVLSIKNSRYKPCPRVHKVNEVRLSDNSGTVPNVPTVSLTRVHKVNEVRLSDNSVTCNPCDTISEPISKSVLDTLKVGSIILHNYAHNYAQ